MQLNRVRFGSKIPLALAELGAFAPTSGITMTIIGQGHAFDVVVHFKPTLDACTAIRLGIGIALGLLSAFMT